MKPEDRAAEGANVSDKPKCSELVWGGWGYSALPCGNTAKVTRKGKWYCGVHDPERKAKRQAEQRAKWDREAAERNAAAARQSACIAACEGVSDPQPGELARVRNIGQMMSNLCFNLAQDDGIAERHRHTMNELRKEWDAATAKETP